MGLPATIASHKQLLQTIGLSSAAFLIALPIGAAVLPNTKTSADGGTTTTVTKSVEDGLACVSGDATGSRLSTTTTTVSRRHTHSHNTNTVGTNNGANAQVGRDGVAVAVNDVLDLTVGDVLSGNTVDVGDVSVPVAGDVLGGTGSSILGDVLGGLGL